jgi:hypothetical protein
VDAEGLFDRVGTKPGEPKEILSLMREALATDLTQCMHSVAAW